VNTWLLRIAADTEFGRISLPENTRRMGCRTVSHMEVIDMPYKIMCWIPIEEEESEIYKTRADAKKEHKHLSHMQPENVYRIVRVDSGEYQPYSRGEKAQRRRHAL
jgi:hypothetical protein